MDELRATAAELAQAKIEHEWLKAAPSHILQQTLRDLDVACREHGTFKVRWRSKARWAPSFRFPAGKDIVVERLGRKWGRAKLPKLGWVTFRWSRPPGGQIRSATVSRRGADWFVSFLVEDGLTTPEHHCGPAVGVDRGVAVAAATSTGDLHDRDFITPGEAARYRSLQQQLARQKKGSNNRAKTRAAMQAIMSRATDRRTDFCAQTAAVLVREHSTVVLEKLPTKAMTASAAGTIAAPGRNVAQKRGLNRAILDKGWHRLELALTSAARYTGTAIVKVPAAYTSQTCYACKHLDRKSRESQADFRCTACGHQDNADVNAAKNILERLPQDMRVAACGDLCASTSTKQEPVSRATGRRHQ